MEQASALPAIQVTHRVEKGMTRVPAVFLSGGNRAFEVTLNGVFSLKACCEAPDYLPYLDPDSLDFGCWNCLTHASIGSHWWHWNELNASELGAYYGEAGYPVLEATLLAAAVEDALREALVDLMASA